MPTDDLSQSTGTVIQFSNATRGTVNYQFWTNKLNALNAQQKQTLTPLALDAFKSGRSHNSAFTLGGPLRIFYSLWFDRIVPLLGKVLPGGAAYTYLPASVKRFPDAESLAALQKRFNIEDYSQK